MTQSHTTSTAIRTGPWLAVALAALSPHLSAFSSTKPATTTSRTTTSPQNRQKHFSADRLLRELEPWHARLAGDLGEVDLSKNPELTELLGELHIVWSKQPEERRRIVESLLDLQGGLLEKLSALPVEQAPSGADESGLKALDEALATKLDHDGRRWLTGETLLLEDQQPALRRAAAARLLGKDARASSTLKKNSVMALLLAARSTDSLVAESALEALVGTEDDTVHLFFLRSLETALEAGDAKKPQKRSTRAHERHFSGLELPAESRAVKRLQHFCRVHTASTDWRVALIALEASQALPRPAAMPALIESLDIWKTRMEVEGGGRRLAYALADELQRRTGRALGLHPDRWKKLWKAVQSGDLALDDGAGAQGRAVSAAAFFGLRPATDRVTFVLDRSGSMDSAFGRSTQSGGTRGESKPGWSRYREAVDQLLHFVESLGEKAKFNVVLFDSGSSIWRSKLQGANPRNLKDVRRWLLRRKPDGGTNLREGVMRALRVGRSGEPDLKELEADTIILLCDGGTNSGPGWVEPFLKRTQEHTRVVFHSVQIGTGGDATLQLLSEGTGGQLVRVEN